MISTFQYFWFKKNEINYKLNNYRTLKKEMEEEAEIYDKAARQCKDQEQSTTISQAYNQKTRDEYVFHNSRFRLRFQISTFHFESDTRFTSG